MSGVASFFNGTDPITLIITFVLLIVTGGIGTAFVTGRMAAKRGIKGDALVKESNGIEGLTNLGNLQGGFITTLQKQINDQQNQIEELKVQNSLDIAQIRTETRAQIEAIHKELTGEIEYSNLLIQTLSENTIPIPPRKRK